MRAWIGVPVRARICRARVNLLNPRTQAQTLRIEKILGQDAACRVDLRQHIVANTKGVGEMIGLALASTIPAASQCDRSCDGDGERAAEPPVTKRPPRP